MCGQRGQRRCVDNDGVWIATAFVEPPRRAPYGDAVGTDRGHTEGDPRLLAQSSTLDGEQGRAVKVNRRKGESLTITRRNGRVPPAGLRRQQTRSQRKERFRSGTFQRNGTKRCHRCAVTLLWGKRMILNIGLRRQNLPSGIGKKIPFICRRKGVAIPSLCRRKGIAIPSGRA